MSGRNVAVVVVVALLALMRLLSGRMIGWGGYGSSGSLSTMLFVGAALICGVVCLGALLGRPSRVAAMVPVAGSTESLDILKERFARGELSREEYDQIREELDR